MLNRERALMEIMSEKPWSVVGVHLRQAADLSGLSEMVTGYLLRRLEEAGRVHRDGPLWRLAEGALDGDDHTCPGAARC